MKTNNLPLLSGVLLICFGLTSSCTSFLEVDTPVGEISSSNVFQTESSTQAAVVGLYSQIMNANNYFLNGGLSLYGGLYADELYNTSANTGYDPFRTSVLSSSNSVVSNNLYRFAYSYIYQANLILENIEGAAISDSHKKQYAGEMYFLRALSYFYLVNLWEDVPLILSTDKEINRLAIRTKKAVVLEQVIKDLVMAENLLASQSSDLLKSRADLYAVKMLLARTYLYTSDYKNAQQKADEVIKSGNYSLEQDLKNVFLSTSKETIMQFIPVGAVFNTAEGFTFLPTSATSRPVIGLYDALVQSFETTDKRATTWIAKRTVSAVSYAYPAKYKVRSNATKTEFNIVFRLAEAYLIRSESSYQLQQISSALSDLNIIRRRAGLSDLPSNITGSLFEQALRTERAHELFTEWGHRWLDLKRWGLATETLSALKPDWQSYKELFPIPNYEIIRNPKMTQNEGYNN